MKGADVDLLLTLKERLAQCERHIAQAERIVRRQRELVAHLLEHSGEDPAAMVAIELLQEFEHWQEMHLTEHARIQSQIEPLERGG